MGCHLITNCYVHIYFLLLGEEGKETLYNGSSWERPWFSQCFLSLSDLFLFPFLLNLSSLFFNFQPPLIVNSSQKPADVCWCSSCLPLFSLSYLLLSARYRALVFVSISRSLFFFSVSEKQKLIKYGTRRSSVSLNHHVIKMASLGDQLKRSRRTMSSPSDIYGPGYVNMLLLFSMYISCNYRFL